jgi:hypothetical protein
MNWSTHDAENELCSTKQIERVLQWNTADNEIKELPNPNQRHEIVLFKQIIINAYLQAFSLLIKLTENSFNFVSVFNGNPRLEAIKQKQNTVTNS